MNSELRIANSESVDQRISGSARKRVSESANQRISGSADQRISEPHNPQPTTHNPALSPQHSAPRTSPFYFPGNEIGVVLIHGFMTSPNEMRLLGESLAAAGMTVSGIRLRGHGTQPEDLHGIRWQDWIEDARAALADLRSRCTRVYLAGLSLGSVVALYTAAGETVDGVVACSTPDYALMHSRGLHLMPFINRRVSLMPKIGSDVRDPVARRAHFTYDHIPLDAAEQLYLLARVLDMALPHVTAPVLLLHARRDRLVTRAAVERVAANLGGPSTILSIERGGHTMVLDYDRERVFEITREWIMGNGNSGLGNGKAEINNEK